MLKSFAQLLTGGPPPVPQYYKHRNILLDTHHAVYMYLPKVACTSLKVAVASLMGLPKAQRIHEIEFPFVPRQELTEGGFSKYFVFSFVRNPLDRLLSCYRNKIHSSGRTDGFFKGGVFRPFLKFNGNEGTRFWAEMTFSEFVTSVSKIRDATADPHFWSQSVALSDKMGQLIPRFIGRFESLQEDWLNVCQLLGVPKRDLPHEMRSNSNPQSYLEFYDPQTWELARSRYQKDFEAFYPGQ